MILCPAILTDLDQMGCGKNDTSKDINIPVVMISKSDGKIIQDNLASGKKGKVVPLASANFLWF